MRKTRNTKKSKTKINEDVQTLGSNARGQSYSRMEDQWSNKYQQQGNFIWEEDLIELKKLLEHKILEYIFYPQEIAKMFEKIENEFPIMNSKEILSAKGPQIKFSKEEVKMLKNYIEELLVGEKVPKMILQNGKQKYILCVSSKNEMQLMDVNEETIILIKNKGDFFDKLRKLEQKYEGIKMSDVQKQLLYLTNQYNKIQKQLIILLQETIQL